jgi:hypothetical protein
MPTRRNNCIATSSAWARGQPRTQIGASVMFSSTVRCGKRLNCWKTMPISIRTRSMSRTSCESRVPSTMISPRWCSSNRLIVRMKVDLPEPDGPKITTTSPRFTSMLIPRRAW